MSEMQMPISPEVVKKYHDLVASSRSKRVPRDFIVQFANLFPCLAAKDVAQFLAPDGWDVEAFMRASRPWSHSEKCAAAFIANVWNPYHAAKKAKRDPRWRFDAIDAVTVWDRQSVVIFAMWAQYPLFP